jgi:hypothetical protein
MGDGLDQLGVLDQYLTLRKEEDVLDHTRMVPSSPVLIAPLPSGNATTE